MANNDQSPTMNGNTSEHESPKSDTSAGKETATPIAIAPPAPIASSHEVKQWSFYRAVIAEFIATLLFIYISLTVVVGASRTGAGSVGILEIAWAFGGMIFVLVYCTAGVSGGHINPAVTFGLLIARKVTIPRAVAYVAAQCAGAMCGAAIAKGVHGHDEFDSFGKNAVNGVASGHTVPQALGAEIMGTFVLLFTVLSATDPVRNARDSHVPVLAPLPIGFAILVVHLATIPITGTGINPARSLGAAVANPHNGRWNQHWIFWVGPLTGAALASLYHSYVMRAETNMFRSSIE